MKILKLTLFLAVVGALAGGTLSYVNSITAPIIEEQGMSAELSNLEVIFPGGEFEAIEITDASGLVEKGYVATNEGYAFKVNVVGYNTGFPIQFLVGFDLEGNIVGFEVLAIQETNGLGSRVADEEFKSGVVGKTVNDSLDTLSGATVSSTAVVAGIDAAKEVYSSVAGVEVASGTSSSSSKEETPAVTIESNEDGKYVVLSQGFHGQNKYEITVEDGAITSVVMALFTDTPGIGDNVNEDYLSTFAGVTSTEDFDVVAGATVTSGSAIAAVQAVLDDIASAE